MLLSQLRHSFHVHYTKLRSMHLFVSQAQSLAQNHLRREYHTILSLGK